LRRWQRDFLIFEDPLKYILTSPLNLVQLIRLLLFYQNPGVSFLVESCLFEIKQSPFFNFPKSFFIIYG